MLCDRQIPLKLKGKITAKGLALAYGADMGNSEKLRKEENEMRMLR